MIDIAPRPFNLNFTSASPNKVVPTPHLSIQGFKYLKKDKSVSFSDLPNSESTPFFIYCKELLHSFGNRFNWLCNELCNRYSSRGSQNGNPRAKSSRLHVIYATYLPLLATGVDSSAPCVGRRHGTVSVIHKACLPLNQS